MRRGYLLFFLSFFLLSCLLPEAVLAQGRGGVTIKARYQKALTTKPGRVFSISYVVSNEGDRQLSLVEEVDLPSGWIPIIPGGSFVLSSGGRVTRVIAFQVPQTAAAGGYEITYRVISRKNPAIRAHKTVNLEVLPVSKLELAVEKKPTAVIAGTRYEIQMRIFNRGNAVSKVRVEAVSMYDYPLSIDPGEFSLPAGESRMFTVTVVTDGKLDSPEPDFLQIVARSVGDAEGEAMAEVNIDMLSRVTGEENLYHRLPTKLSLQMVGVDQVDEDEERDFQVEWRGSGTLDKAGRKEISFRFRGPDVQNDGIYGLRDEYWLRYATPDIGLCIGDWSYGPSPLTSESFYGRGVQVEYHPEGEKWGIGSYYLRSRWDEPEEREKGLYLDYAMKEDLSLGFNFVQRDIDEDKDSFGGRPALRDTLWSVESVWSPSEFMELELEYGRSTSDRRNVGDDEAYRMEWRGFGDGGVSYSLSRIFAGADYYGYYHGYEYTEAAVGFPLLDRLNCSLSYSEYDENPERNKDGEGNVDQTTAASERLYQIGFDYDLSGGWYVGFGYDDFDRSDKLSRSGILRDEPGFDFAERSFWMSLGRMAGRFGFTLESRYGELEDRLRKSSRNLQTYDVTLTYTSSDNFSLSFYGGFGDTDELEDAFLLGYAGNYGASFTWTPRLNFYLMGWYSKYNYDKESDKQYEQYSLSTAYTWPNEHSLAFQVDKYDYEEEEDDETSYRLSYVIPISLKVSRNRDVGTIEGRVYDALSPDHSGLPGAVLTCDGATAVTDDDGKFLFASVAPGRRAVWMDRGFLGLNRTATRSLPVIVEVPEASTVSVDIGITEAARLSGRVIRNADDVRTEGVSAGGDGGKEEGLVNILVEVSNGAEEHRRVTDSTGAFLFDALPPGRWHLKVYPYGVPSTWKLKNPERDVDLIPGKSEEFLVRAVPVKRKIKFIDEATIK